MPSSTVEQTETETETKTENALITNSQVLNTVYSSVSIGVNLAMFERTGLPVRKVVR